MLTGKKLVCDYAYVPRWYADLSTVAQSICLVSAWQRSPARTAVSWRAVRIGHKALKKIVTSRDYYSTNIRLAKITRIFFKSLFYWFLFFNSNARELIANKKHQPKNKAKVMGHNLDYEAYRKYIDSIEWKNKAKFIRSLDKNTCQICNFKLRAYGIVHLRPDAKYLEVHHLTYDRLFKERLTDLVTLCQACHDDISRLKKIQKATLNEALETVCKKFNKTADQIKAVISKRSKNIDWFYLKPKNAKKRQTTKKPTIFAVCGTRNIGLFLNGREAQLANASNRKGKCRRFKIESYARKWLERRVEKLKTKGMTISPKAIFVDDLQPKPASDNEQSGRRA